MTPGAVDAAFWRGLQSRVDAPPERPRDPLWLAAPGEHIGSIEPALARRMAAAALPISAAGAGWCVAAADAMPGDAALARIARWLHAQGVVSAWRDELLVVTDAHGMPRGRIERAAVRPLGIATRAVHLIGLAPDGRVWVQQRAFDKATDPGQWDTLMGGLQAAGESDAATLERETWEEAGLRIADLHGLRAADRLTVRRPVAEGYMVEHIEVFVATVPHGMLPDNRDGEVVGFACLPIAGLIARLRAGEFTAEAAALLARWLETQRCL
jgi:8-oxo-dGTP pyrophosphatase MutT (NUDIX family)